MTDSVLNRLVVMLLFAGPVAASAGTLAVLRYWDVLTLRRHILLPVGIASVLFYLSIAAADVFIERINLTLFQVRSHVMGIAGLVQDALIPFALYYFPCLALCARSGIISKSKAWRYASPVLVYATSYVAWCVFLGAIGFPLF